VSCYEQINYDDDDDDDDDLISCVCVDCPSVTVCSKGPQPPSKWYYGGPKVTARPSSSIYSPYANVTSVVRSRATKVSSRPKSCLGCPYANGTIKTSVPARPKSCIGCPYADGTSVIRRGATKVSARPKSYLGCRYANGTAKMSAGFSKCERCQRGVGMSSPACTRCRARYRSIAYSSHPVQRPTAYYHEEKQLKEQQQQLQQQLDQLKQQQQQLQQDQQHRDHRAIASLNPRHANGSYLSRRY